MKYKISKNKKSHSGNKAAGLFFLRAQNLNTPDFYVIDNKCLEYIDLNKPKLYEIINNWVNKYKISKNTLWAVRSSTSLEDSIDKSYAGRFHTELNVKINDIDSAILNVLNSYKKVDFKDSKNGIIIQKMLLPEISGVIFTSNPISFTDELIINAIPGLGDDLVSGKNEAFQIVLKNKKEQYSELNRKYPGTSNNKKFKISGKQISDKIIIHKNHINKSIKKLERLKKYPLDIEFAIENDTFYWLQIRPITGYEKAKNQIIWDNTNIGDNYPGVNKPLTNSFVKYSYSKAYTSMANFLGMTKSDLQKNTPLLENMVGAIQDRLYYNVTAWQKLLLQLPFGNKTSQYYPKLMNMNDVIKIYRNKSIGFSKYLVLLVNIVKAILFFGFFKKQFEKKYQFILNKYSDFDYSKKTYQQLTNIFTDIEKKLAEKWTVPVVNGFLAMLFHSLLKHIVNKSKIHKKYPNFVNDILFTDDNVISVKIIKDFQFILNKIHNNKEVKDLFNNNDIEYIKNNLKNKYTIINQLIIKYINDYGERISGGELKLETVNYKENPDLFIQYIKANIYAKVPNKNVIKKTNYKTIINQMYQFNVLKKYTLYLIVKITRNRMRDRENYRFLRTKSFHVIRMLFRELDKKLVEDKKLKNKNDSLFLNIEELLDSTKNLAEIVKRRKSDYYIYIKEKEYYRYIQKNNRLLPVEKTSTKTNKSDIKGIGCSSGVAKAKALIIKDIELKEEIVKDKILISKYFEPGWFNLFSQAKGIISERGNLLSHTSILSRELGLPSIVGVNDILDIVKNGDVIEMNGSTGTIKIVK